MDLQEDMFKAAASRLWPLLGRDLKSGLRVCTWCMLATSRFQVRDPYIRWSLLSGNQTHHCGELPIRSGPGAHHEA